MKKTKTKPTIVLYTGPNCKYCTLAKEYFKKEGLEYTEHNVAIDKTAKETLFSMGVRSVPLIVINGDPVLGFDETYVANKIKSI